MSPATLPPDWERFYPGRTIGARLLAYGEVDSTMDVARSLATAGAPHGVVVRAEVQRLGRGRFARRWESAAGDSLLTSTILRMPPVPIGAPLSVTAALAVHECVGTFIPEAISIKWPNDVLIEGRKVAGILTESSVSTDGTGFAVVGIGLNVNLDTSRVSGLAESATSLAEHVGSSLDLDEVEDCLFQAFDHWAAMLEQSPSEVIAEWRRRLATLGQHINVHTRDGVLSGVAEDVDGQGRLLLRDSRGHVHTLGEGDVSLRA